MDFSHIPKIQVIVRKRPLTSKELSKNDKDIVDVIGKKVVVKEKRKKVDLSEYTEEHKYKFDGAFSDLSTNEDIYSEIVNPLVSAALHGVKVTCFAYGQTGSGKTFTMMGNGEKVNTIPGLYLLSAVDIFRQIQALNMNNINVCISLFEIYCGKAYDLLNERNECPIREDGGGKVNIVGITETVIGGVDSIMQLINYGSSVRVTGQTGANDSSSRSHAVLRIVFRDKQTRKTQGKMSFIDLAGSERGADVNTCDKQTRIDGSEINKSLLALKECIRALDQGKNHVPFRGSKLTLVLRDSFVGNCKTVMIGNISPALGSCEHTLNTLRYADRVKELKSGKTSKPTNRGSLADNLMLARNNKHSTKTMIKEDRNSENINVMRFDENFGGFNQIKSGKMSMNKRVSAPLHPINKISQMNTEMGMDIESFPRKEQPMAPIQSYHNKDTFLQRQESSQIAMDEERPSAPLPQDAPLSSYPELYKNHEELIEEILAKEEEILIEHRSFVANFVEIIKSDMQLIQQTESEGKFEVLTPDSNIRSYVEKMKKMLTAKSSMINSLHRKIDDLSNKLDKERDLTQQLQNSNDFDDEINLLDEIN